MDVDNDVDQILLQQFSCMGTTDKEELIKQLQALVNQQLTSAAASFFLEMNNWNLQAAVGSYFDIHSSTNNASSMLLVSDEPLTDGGDIVPPNTRFIKTWQIQNNGLELWPSDCYLQFTGGVNMCDHEKIPVLPLGPSCCVKILLEMTSPSEPGIYQSQWRMTQGNGSYFGDVIWVILTVSDLCMNGLVTQFSHLSDLGSLPRSAVPQPINPFNSARPSQLYQESVPPSQQDGDGNMMC